METPVKTIRSAKRKRTVSAKWVNGTIEVYAPANISDKELQPIIKNLKNRILLHQEKRQLKRVSNLTERAQILNQRFFDGRLRFRSVEYVTNQNRQFGSCTPRQGTIRISYRVAKLPQWVQDYVLVHELAHLEQPNHSKAFWKLVDRYPLAERARGYLMARDFRGQRRL